MILTSVLHPYSYGQVVEDNPDQSRTIKVKILEHLATQYGIPDNVVDNDSVDVPVFNGEIPTDAGGSYGSELKTVNVSFKDFVPANWLNRTANTISPPKVVKGQRVILWRVGDSRQYYWEELDVDMRLKPDEHILIAINNHNNGEQLDLNNAYIIEYSTRDQRIRMRTNRNNGEKAAYEVDLNGRNGFMKLMDDCQKAGDSYNGNGLLVDSVNTKVILRNINDSHYILDKEDIFVNCKGNRTSTIGGTDKTTAKVIEDNSQSHTMNTKTYTENADSVSVNAKSITESAPSISIGGGSLAIAAAMSVAGAGGGGAAITMSGTLSMDGQSTFSAPVAFNGPVTFSQHVQGVSSTWSVSCDHP